MAVVFFGSNFTIVKKYDSGDGMFFQLWMCMGIWTVGLVVHLIRGAPKFWPFAMLGGCLWVFGNALCVYIIEQIGMGLGLVVWGSTLMLVGWFTGFFGLFGTKKDDVAVVWLNILGLILALASLILSFFVKVSHHSKTSTPTNRSGNFMALPQSEEESGELKSSYPDDSQAHVRDEGRPIEPAETVARSKLRGIVCAMCAGFFFGINFDPPTYIQQHNCQEGNGCDEHYRGASSDPLDYVFAHFCGVLMMAMFIFFGYAIYKRNNPWISSRLCLPAYLSGVVWALGQVGWFIANGSLGYTVTFPLAGVGPGIVGSIWSVFVFKEIRGTKNFLLLGGVFGLAISTAICIVVSKS